MAGIGHRGFMGRKKEPVGLPFIFSVTVGSGQSFQLPTISGGTYDCIVDWGDGGSDTLTVWNASSRNHTYISAGTYDISISGVFEGWSVNNYADRLKIVDVKQWGIFSWGTTAANGFYGCGNLVVTATDMFDTSNVASLNSTFQGCSSLTSLDVSGWDTSNVTNLGSTFQGCSSLTSLDVSGWDTGSVTTFQQTFRNCSSLTSLDVSGWDTSNVTNLGSTFYNCSSLTSLDVSGWDTGSVNTLNQTFQGCSSLTSLDVSGWDTSNVANLGSTFYNCSSLTSLDVSGWDTGSVNTLNQTFRNCSSLTSLDVSGWDTSNVTNITGTFYNCTLISPDTSTWPWMQVAGAELFAANVLEYNSEIKLDLVNMTGYFKQVFNYSKIKKCYIKNSENITGTIFSGQPSPFIGCIDIEWLEFGGLKKSLNISYCIALTKPALLALADSVYDMTGDVAPTMTLPNTAAGTDPDVLNAFAAKNWNT